MPGSAFCSFGAFYSLFSYFTALVNSYPPPSTIFLVLCYLQVYLAASALNSTCGSLLQHCLVEVYFLTESDFLPSPPFSEPFCFFSSALQTVCSVTWDELNKYISAEVFHWLSRFVFPSLKIFLELWPQKQWKVISLKPLYLSTQSCLLYWQLKRDFVP